MKLFEWILRSDPAHVKTKEDAIRIFSEQGHMPRTTVQKVLNRDYNKDYGPTADTIRRISNVTFNQVSHESIGNLDFGMSSDEFMRALKDRQKR